MRVTFYSHHAALQLYQSLDSQSRKSPSPFMPKYLRITLAFVILPLLLATLAPAAHAKRVALVVGNASYAERPLKNPVNDANLMDTTLRGLGFEVTVLRNVDRRALLTGLREFEAKARDAEVALFFFAGHGAQVGGNNYLLPVGGNLQSEIDVPDEAVEASSVLRRLEDARSRVALVILDACRDNPYAGSRRSASRGLARMNVSTGTIVAYATAPGSTAADGAGSNGVYTEQLARQLKTPGLDIKDVFDRTAQEVERLTNGKQRPREEVGLRGRFVLNASASVQTPLPQPEQSTSTFGSSRPGTVRVIKIGHVGPTSGQIAHLGKDNENGARLAIAEANANNPKIGDERVRFELIAQDDAADKEQALRMAQSLVAAGVVGVIGHLNSGTSIPASAIYHTAGLPQITPSATNPRLTLQGFPGVFRMMGDDIRQGRAIGKFAVEGLGAKRVAFLDDRTAYGLGLMDEAERAVNTAGGTVVIREALANAKDQDFKGVLTKIKAKAPDVIIFGGMDAQLGPMLRQIRALGIKAKVMGGDGTKSSELIKLAGDAAEGVYAIEAGLPMEQMPRGMAFYKKFKERFNADVQLFAPYTYDATNVLISSMQKARSTDGAKVMSAMRSSAFNGVAGTYEFDNEGDLRQAPFTVGVVKNGAWQVMQVVRASSP
jgi:branched-chain amino acid transport system substrate-binding protein